MSACEYDAPMTFLVGSVGGAGVSLFLRELFAEEVRQKGDAVLCSMSFALEIERGRIVWSYSVRSIKAQRSPMSAMYFFLCWWIDEGGQLCRWSSRMDDRTDFSHLLRSPGAGRFAEIHRDRGWLCDHCFVMLGEVLYRKEDLYIVSQYIGCT